MEWLNYHHLLYFWAVAKEGSIAAACKKLLLTQPTISAQIRTLERSLGQKLFSRSGRNLVLTESGHMVYRYADEIFALGRELQDALRDRPTRGSLRLQVGVADVVPKLIAHRLLAPAFRMPEPVQVVCVEGKPTDLLARLSGNELDVVIMDTPITHQIKVRAYNHLLGECGVSIFGTEAMAHYRKGFPGSLNGAPFLLPAPSTALRRSLDRWFDAKGIRPAIVGEFEDTALLKVFGQSGAGLFPAARVIEQNVKRQYSVKLIGRLDQVKEQFYAISLERRVKHPAVSAIVNAARDKFFS
jgi:LysR family transcriptional activator of nhaA